MTTVTESCLCGATGGKAISLYDLPMLHCPECGILRQDVPMTRAELLGWYATRYFEEGIYYHTYEHDVEVAESRLREYELQPGSRILDVGSGNSAFVDRAVAFGIEAWGQDLADASSGRTFVGDLAGIAFPPHYFDTVTMHDVLEHVPDPVATLEEISRILEPGGTLIVDFPRFHHEAGRHHWKETEHIWMLDERQLGLLLRSTGFDVEAEYNPIESKVVVRAVNRRQHDHVRILVPPGIGDGYWVLSKLRAFLDARGLYLPEVFVHDSGPRRSAGLWERVPFVRFGGYAKINAGQEWNNAYHGCEHPVQENVQGFDYFLSFNGTMDHGLSLDEAMPGPTNWFEPLFRPLDHAQMVSEYQEKFGEYVVVSFYDKGFYSKWLRDFPPDAIISALRRIADERTVIVTGAEWDRGGLSDALLAADGRFAGLVGRTSFTQLFALLDGASAIFGHPAGNTMLGPYLGTPTVMIWGNTFPEAFRTNACPESHYLPLDGAWTSARHAADALLEMVP